MPYPPAISNLMDSAATPDLEHALPGHVQGKPIHPLTEHDLHKIRGGKLLGSMPRLTNQRYLDINHDLSLMWRTDDFTYGTLSPNEQWDLHAYFVPYKSLSEAELLAHRKRISKERPSLPQRAGRAAEHFKRNYYLVRDARRREAQEAPEHQAARAAASKKSGYRTAPRPKGPVKVYAIVNPEIDVKMLARACIGIARLQLAEGKERRVK